MKDGDKKVDNYLSSVFAKKPFANGDHLIELCAMRAKGIDLKGTEKRMEKFGFEPTEDETKYSGKEAEMLVTMINKLAELRVKKRNPEDKQQMADAVRLQNLDTVLDGISNRLDPAAKAAFREMEKKIVAAYLTRESKIDVDRLVATQNDKDIEWNTRLTDNEVKRVMSINSRLQEK
ncbi:MAG: hypothetical protein HW383_409 [Candidatus Magasanikbacteria bacterium]|nr:hypothetical protein [Candidatus Magasanikbacteria bacterium]